MTDRAELIATLGVTRLNGYATESEESTPVSAASAWRAGATT